MAQRGSAPDWGSGGRCKSCQPDVKAPMRSHFRRGFVMCGDEFFGPTLVPSPRHRCRLTGAGGHTWLSGRRRLWISGPNGDQSPRSWLPAPRNSDLEASCRLGLLALADRARKASACSVAVVGGAGIRVWSRRRRGRGCPGGRGAGCRHRHLFWSDRGRTCVGPAPRSALSESSPPAHNPAAATSPEPTTGTGAARAGLSRPPAPPAPRPNGN